MTYLIFDTKQEADERSRQAWEEHLGRKKRPEDVTEFLWSRNVGKDGRTALVISEKQELLKVPERNAMVETLDANWEKEILEITKNG